MTDAKIAKALGLDSPRDNPELFARGKRAVERAAGDREAMDRLQRIRLAFWGHLDDA
jgi:hypothetical protein